MLMHVPWRGTGSMCPRGEPLFGESREQDRGEKKSSHLLFVKERGNAKRYY